MPRTSRRAGRREPVQPKRSARAAGTPRAATLPDGPGRAWLLLPVLLVVVAAAYQPAWHGGLLWDDDAHLTRAALRSGQGLWRIWTDVGATQQYYPLLHTAFWIQHRLWGDAVTGYHLVSISLHAISAWLIALILLRFSVPGAVLAATVFALHPVHVESVAWMSELKNTLSGVLCLTSASAYFRFDETRATRDYLLGLLCFALGLLTKTVIATLPVALLIVFWWRRGRVTIRQDVRPLVPFMALGALGGLLTVWVERTLIGAQGVGFDLTPVDRLLVAGRAIWFYLGKLAWPAGLTFIYPRWEVDPSQWQQFLYPLGALALGGGLWALRHRSRRSGGSMTQSRICRRPWSRGPIMPMPGSISPTRCTRPGACERRSSTTKLPCAPAPGMRPFATTSRSRCSRWDAGTRRSRSSPRRFGSGRTLRRPSRAWSACVRHLLWASSDRMKHVLRHPRGRP